MSGGGADVFLAVFILPLLAILWVMYEDDRR